MSDLPDEIPHGMPDRLRTFRELLRRMPDREVVEAMWCVVTERLAECSSAEEMERLLAGTIKATTLRAALKLRLQMLDTVNTPDGDANCNVRCMGCGGTYVTSTTYFESGKCQCPTCRSSKAQRCP